MQPGDNHDIHRRDGIERCCVAEIRDRRAQADRDAVRLMGSPKQLKASWMDVDYLLSVIDGGFPHENNKG